VPDPLAPGLAPPDLPAWFTQQFKWARGVFETLLVAYPRYFTRLTLRQRLVYAVRMTYYWFGLVIFLHLAAVIYVLLSADRALLAALESYLQHLLPLMLLVLLIRLLALRRWRHNTVPRNAQWRPIILVYATWPIYTVAWWMALLRLPLRFRLTPKTPAGHLHPNWILGQMVAMFLLIAGLTYHLITLRGQFYPLTVAFVCAQIVPHWLFFWFFRTTKLHDRRTEPLPSVLPARTSWHDKPVETDS
jgi:cellulose synthase (UDP-forming)